jgi:hypothetical protein
MKRNYYLEKVAAVKRLLSGENFNSVSQDTGIKYSDLKLILIVSI